MNALMRISMRPVAFQRGVGLIELLVAMVLGALIVIGVVQVFTANKQTFRMQDAMALTQETGTYALDFMARDLLRAGFPGFPVADDAFDWVNTVDGGAGANDTLAVTYSPDVANDLYCTGEATGAALRISNRYWVNADNELVCQGAAQDPLGTYQLVGTPQVLVDNVESFQVLFGVDLEHSRDSIVQPLPGDPADPADCDDNPSEPTAYITADRVAAALVRGTTPAKACLQQMTALQVVRSVRIGLLLRTPDPTGAVVPADRTYSVLDMVVGADGPQVIAADDGRLRRLFTKTVSLRNVEERIE